MDRFLPISFSGNAQVPKIAIIDYQHPEGLDINGDGIPDSIDHAEFAKRIIQAECPQAQVDIFISNDQDAASIANTLRSLNGYDAINLSLGFGWPYEEPVLLGDRILRLTPKNLKANREVLIDWLRKVAPPIAELMDAVREKAEKGIKMYLAPGNLPFEFSWLSLVKDCFHVGATDANGVLEAYSADHECVNRLEQGTIGIAEVPGGFDINGDGKPEIFDEEVSKGIPIVKKFVGKPLEQVQVTADEIKLIQDNQGSDLLSQRLFSLHQLVELGMPKLDIAIMHHLGEYAAVTSQGKLVFGFRTSKDGLVVFDPDNSHRLNLISYRHGFSYSSPKAAGKDAALSL